MKPAACKCGAHALIVLDTVTSVVNVSCSSCPAQGPEEATEELAIAAWDKQQQQGVAA